MYILIFGSGKVAQAVASVLKAENVSYGFYSQGGRVTLDGYLDQFQCKEDQVILHLGSGREIESAIRFAEVCDVPLIQGSTKLTTAGGEKIDEDALIQGRGLTYVKAPNLSLPIVRFMKAYPDFANVVCKDMNGYIMESHQSTKKDVSGTARAIVPRIGLSEESIISIRDKELQQKLGVPHDYLNGHAYHFFINEGQGVVIEVVIKVDGRDTYGYGAISVARMLLNKREQFRGKTHFLPDIIEWV